MNWKDRSLKHLRHAQDDLIRAMDQIPRRTALDEIDRLTGALVDANQAIDKTIQAWRGGKVKK